MKSAVKALIAAALLAAGLWWYYTQMIPPPMGEQRENFIKKTGLAKIGLVCPTSNTSFINGANLAVEQVNERGGLLGARLSLDPRDDQNDKDAGVNIAKSLLKDVGIAGVTGHMTSDNAIAASLIYNMGGMVFLAPQATSTYLTLHRFETVFRTIVSDKDVSRELVAYLRKKGLNKLVVASEQSRYGSDFSNLLIDSTGRMGIKIASHKFFFETDTDFRHGLLTVLNEDFDSIFIAGHLPAGALLIKQIREMGFQQQIITGGALTSPQLISLAGKASEGVVVAAHFNLSDKSDPDMVNFVAKYKARYNMEPDQNSARGYEAVWLLTQGIERAKSFNPVVIASTMKVAKNWQGLSGTYSFSRYGNVQGRRVYLETVKNGKFVPLEEFTLKTGVDSPDQALVED